MAPNTGLLAGLDDVNRFDPAHRAWVVERIRRLDADARRSADTHLWRLELPTEWGIDLYLKDESTHPTGSLKHRLARSLFTYALVNGWLGPGTLVVEASSGSTAVSEAYFARMLDLPFVAVVPRSTSVEKIRLIEAEGGRCHLPSQVTASSSSRQPSKKADRSTSTTQSRPPMRLLVDRADQMCSESKRLAAEHGGHFLDQFTYAERATDWRGHNNIAESILDQLAEEPHPEPSWVVVGAGTGGTSATIGRYLRFGGGGAVPLRSPRTTSRGLHGHQHRRSRRDGPRDACRG